MSEEFELSTNMKEEKNKKSRKKIKNKGFKRIWRSGPGKAASFARKENKTTGTPVETRPGAELMGFREISICQFSFRI